MSVHYRLSSGVQLLFIFFACISAAVVHFGNEGQMICIPNATFHIDCNRCKCSPTGMSIDCTDWTCATLQIPHDLLLNLTLDCHPGEIFLYNDHKCLCTGSSQAICTSAYIELAHNLRPTTGSIISSGNSPGKCTPGLVFKNKCDTCICADNARAACLGTGCIRHADKRRFEGPDFTGNYPHRKSASEKLCVPYSIFSVDCNQCVCSDDGLSMSCDSYPCLGVEMRDDQMLNITFRCEANSSFLYNGYECLCSSRGKTALCSLTQYDKSKEFREAGKKVYAIAEFAELCTPGMVFKDRCNVCICAADEKAACVRIDCDLSWKYSRASAEEEKDSGVTERIIPKEEIWTQRLKGSTRKFCRRNAGSMYCRYLRNF